MPVTEQQLIEYLTSQQGIGDVEADTPLFSGGLLDSVAMLDLIGFIETTSRCEVAQADVTLENFDNVAAIIKYVGKVSNGGGR